MKKHKLTIGSGICAMMLFIVTGMFGTLARVAAQDENASKPGSERPALRGARDPFVKYKVVIAKKTVKSTPMPLEAPPIQDRIDRYKAQKLAAMNAQQSPPKATTALLLNELQVIGIFRTPRGTAAMVEATPIKLSYVVYPGETFYDGQLVAIEENRLIFRHVTHWTDGRLVKDVAIKPLRKPDAVTDSLAATKGSGSNPTAENSSAKGAPKKEAAPDKQ